MTSYRTYLRSVGRKSVAKLKLRTTRQPGHVEIVRDPKTGEERLHRFGEEVAPPRTDAKVVPLRGRSGG